MLYRNLKFFPFFIALFLVWGCSFTSSAPKAPPGGTKRSNQATMRPYTINGKTYYPTVVSVGDKQSGIASWYGPNFHGKRTSNGEEYDMHAMTAAHKTYPMNTVVLVKNVDNGMSAVVRVNDRGPFVSGRVIDLSRSAADKIGMLGRGTASVNLEVIGFGGSKAPTKDGGVMSGSQVYTGGTFMVQIGAFRRYAGAQIYKNKFDNTQGYKSSIREFALDNEPIYRVFLTGFRSEDEARDFIAQSQFNGAFIARDR